MSFFQSLPEDAGVRHILTLNARPAAHWSSSTRPHCATMGRWNPPQGADRCLRLRSQCLFALTEPTLMFLPRPDQHRMVADEGAGADVVCATVQLGGTSINSITASLPTWS